MITEAVQALGYRLPTREQLLVTEQFVSGRDVFVLLPTGCGKSVCYGCLPLDGSSKKSVAGGTVCACVRAHKMQNGNPERNRDPGSRTRARTTRYTRTRSAVLDAMAMAEAMDDAVAVIEDAPQTVSPSEKLPAASRCSSLSVVPCRISTRP